MKAILILDEMPEDCNHCRLAGYIEECDMYYCSPADESCKPLMRYVNDLPRGFKPDWCPLRPLPEAKQYDDELYLDDEYVDGWNACLDAITGGD